MPTIKFLETGAGSTLDLTLWTSRSGNANADISQSYSGPVSVRIGPTASTLKKFGILAAAGRISFRVRTDIAASTNREFLELETEAAFPFFVLELTAAGHLRCTPFGATSVIGTATLSASTWYRITISYTYTNTTTFQFSVYVNGVLDATCTAGTMSFSGTAVDALALICDGVDGEQNWFTDIYVDDGSDYSDPGNIRLTAKRPVANGTTNGFTTQVGTSITAAVTDSFNRANNASSMGNADTGQTWVPNANPSGGASGTPVWGIISNKAYDATGFDQDSTVIDTGLYEVTLQATVTGISGASDLGFVVLSSDSDNYYLIDFENAGNDISLYALNSGVFQPVLHTVAASINDGDTISVSVKLWTFTIKVNGATIFAYTDTVHQKLGTKHGIRVYSPAEVPSLARFDDFSITPLGTGHAIQVNERPNELNGWAVTVAGSPITEEYNVEGKAAGDIDISGLTIVGTMGWVIAKSLTSETAQIIVDGNTTNISLTSTLTGFMGLPATPTYPSGAGADIGIVTDPTATTVTLYEAGIIVAYTDTPSRKFLLVR